MKTELKAKFLQHLASQKKKNEGFTLIELLVVVIIIGILAAIALPSMLNQSQKARTSGAQSQAGAVNRAQQAYRLENPSFGTSVTALQIGSSTAVGYGAPVVNATSSEGSVSFTTQVGVNAKNVTGLANADSAGNTTISVTVAP